jgi:hypothetical protein
MAYVIFNHDAPLNEDFAFTKIARDASSLDKVRPANMSQFYVVYDISDDNYNALRLGTKTCRHDGTAVTFSDVDFSPVPGETIVALTEAKLIKEITSYTDVIRSYMSKNKKVSDSTKTDWLNYADTVDELDYSTFTGTDIRLIIEDKGTTFRSLAELPVT